MRNSARNNFVQSNNLKILLIIAASILTFYAIFAAFSNSYIPHKFFNSDTLFSAKVYKDFLHSPSELFHIYFGPDNFLLTAIPIYFLIASAFSANLPLTMLVYGFIAPLLLVGMSLMLANIHPLRPRLLFLLAISSLFMLLANGGLGLEVLNKVFYNGFHFITMLCALASLLIIIKILEKNKTPILLLALLGFISIITAFSDPLFISDFAIPAIATLLFIRILILWKKINAHKATLINLLIITLVSCVFFSHVITPLLHMHIASFPIHMQLSLVRAHKFAQLIENFLHHNMAYTLIIFMTTTLIITNTITTLISIKKTQSINSNFSFTPLFMNLFFTLAIIWSTFAIIAFDQNLMANNYFGLRHYRNILLLPIMVYLPWCIANLIEKYKLDYYKMITVGLLALIIYSPFIKVTPNTITKALNFYPPLAKCVDKYSKHYHLDRGIAGYWMARRTTFFNKSGALIRAVDGNIQPMLWLANGNNYVNYKFNFALTATDYSLNTNTQALFAKYGKPDFTVKCGPYSNILIYKKYRTL